MLAQSGPALIVSWTDLFVGPLDVMFLLYKWNGLDWVFQYDDTEFSQGGTGSHEMSSVPGAGRYRVDMQVDGIIDPFTTNEVDYS